MAPEKIKKIRLLLVDDEADFRKTLAKRLAKRGIDARQADDGETCLSMLSSHPMDVVVMDVKMPGMSGIEALGRIKKSHGETEVILLTGHAATDDGVEGIKSGAFDYLTKPVEFDHLLRKIIQAYDGILGKKQKEEAAEFKARVHQQMVATERLAALGTLAAGIAHEINNPLAIIKESAGYLGSLMKKEEMADMPRREVFEKVLLKIDASVKRARTITHQLLGSVRKTESISAEVNVAKLVKETVGLVNREAKDKDVSVVLKTDDDLATVWVDPNQLRQVMINLLSNAIYATPQEGRITVDLKHTDEGVSIAVSDTGCGIPEENLVKIFEPFFSTKSPGEGTGLGLFVTREMVDKLGGTIAVDSQFGYGTRFTVRIPGQQKC